MRFFSLSVAGTIAAGLTLISTAAFADSADPMTAQPAAAVSSPSGRIVCHYMVHDGVFIKKPVCKSQEQWNRDRRESQRDFATFQMRTYSAPFR